MGYATERFDTEREWLDARGIGGSSASAIVDQNPWEDKWQLYDRLTKGNRSPEKKSKLLDYGHRVEPTIRRMFALDHPNLRVVAPKGYEMYRRADKPYLTATVDGILLEGKGRKGILEIKSHEVRKAGDMDEWRDGRIPPNYLIQVLHYLIVIEDAQFVDFAVKHRFYEYDGEISKTIRSEVHYLHLERADAEAKIAWLEAQETDFYENHVMRGMRPPAPTKVETLF